MDFNMNSLRFDCLFAKYERPKSVNMTVSGSQFDTSTFIYPCMFDPDCCDYQQFLKDNKIKKGK